MRLDKFLSESSPYSRREIKELIKRRAVSVNGKFAEKADEKVSDRDEIRVDGELIKYSKFVYLMLNKPQDYISATEDKKYKTVTDLVPERYRHYNVFPVGRLDIDTEGLLLLTNDGAFDHAVISPKKNVYKRYFARLDKPCGGSDIDAFAAGMEFKDFTAKPAKLEICEERCEAYVEIAEGKFHQVKRMFERVGKTVVYLKRTAIGRLELPPDLMIGEMRELTESEKEKVMQN